MANTWATARYVADPTRRAAVEALKNGMCMAWAPSIISHRTAGAEAIEVLARLR